ncbi:benzoyl-CoA 2,3-epoxidase subunit BoxA [Salinisphaera aquimarina]|uniref:Benzoyl-CoA 2,3-epoxidase subunit BoxA n=1 Tax=Salinisphaera aquimarina TaxID=2094031 RepID=A0ABV7EP40_9GAMM
MSLQRQHLIDPEICIRCNTCEETCPIDAVTHTEDNYIVDVDKCNLCMDCISPCPTGAIDNWRTVLTPYTLEEQGEWDELPEQEAHDEETDDVQPSAAAAATSDDAEQDTAESRDLLTAAHGGQARLVAPASAAHAYVNVYSRREPALARVTGNYRLTDGATDSDTRHIVLDFGKQAFPVIEGQSIGVLPPGEDERGKPHRMRLYTVSSPRDGERPNYNNVALTVKREFGEGDSAAQRGVASNYLCDLARGDEVRVVGPFGDTFVMPNDPQAHIVMICTGTGSAPFRAMTERRRRHMADVPGRLMLFFGARRPEELPYLGPLRKLPAGFIDVEFAYSRVPDQPREYVQDRMRARADDLAALLEDDNTHVFICGLKGMEQGVADAFAEIALANGHDWDALYTRMCASGRYHFETY